MQESSATTDLRGAFELLRDAIKNLEERGRSTESAGVKPEMQRLTGGEFNEKNLGFSSFGAFVAAAENADLVVRIETVPGHPMIKSTRATGTPSPTAARVTNEALPSGPRLRPDLWRAFVDWRPEITRVYDKKKGKALMFPAAPGTNSTKEEDEIRLEADREKDRFVPIAPIPMETQYRWIKEFIETHGDNPLAVALRSTMEQARPIKAFSHVIRADPNLAQAWRSSRLARVAAVVTEWIGSQGLPIQPWEQPATTPLRREQARGIAAASNESLRALIHAAVDRMPAAELLRLSIPLEYLTRHTP